MRGHGSLGFLQHGIVAVGVPTTDDADSTGRMAGQGDPNTDLVGRPGFTTTGYGTTDLIGRPGVTTTGRARPIPQGQGVATGKISILDNRPIPQGQGAAIVETSMSPMASSNDPQMESTTSVVPGLGRDYFDTKMESTTSVVPGFGRDYFDPQMGPLGSTSPGVSTPDFAKAKCLSKVANGHFASEARTGISTEPMDGSAMGSLPGTDEAGSGSRTTRQPTMTRCDHEPKPYRSRNAMEETEKQFMPLDKHCGKALDNVSGNNWEVLPQPLVIDSGAAETVMPTDWCSQYPTTTSAGQRNGDWYTAAYGEPIWNEGEKTVLLSSLDSSQWRTMTFQLATVNKALGSVSQNCKTATEWYSTLMAVIFKINKAVINCG